jgi:hypothetical protein
MQMQGGGYLYELSTRTKPWALPSIKNKDYAWI